jgi:hypothetical protein
MRTVVSFQCHLGAHTKKLCRDVALLTPVGVTEFA